MSDANSSIPEFIIALKADWSAHGITVIAQQIWTVETEHLKLTTYGKRPKACLVASKMLSTRLCPNRVTMSDMDPAKDLKPLSVEEPEEEEKSRANGNISSSDPEKKVHPNNATPLDVTGLSDDLPPRPVYKARCPVRTRKTSMRFWFNKLPTIREVSAEDETADKLASDFSHLMMVHFKQPRKTCAHRFSAETTPTGLLSFL
ncbi:uncharacterized protein [Hyperolius riggenbachi]|uniref:uncharacterized protein n=1 Tax=Hyperolius riggenbachi TaxID=752182 RepID=UPI0035A27587